MRFLGGLFLALSLVSVPTPCAATASAVGGVRPIPSSSVITNRVVTARGTAAALPGTLLVVRYRRFSLCCPSGGQVFAITKGRISVFLKHMTRGAPAISPDHRTVAFGRDTLYLIDANGTHFRRVVPPPASPCQNPLAVSDVAWSPNGRMLAYRVIFDTDEIRPCPTGVRDAPGIWVVNIRHPHPVQVPLDGDFTWGPSDSALTVDGTVFDLRTRTRHNLVRGLHESVVAIAPRSRQIAYVTENRGNRSTLWEMQRNGQNRRPVASVTGYVSSLQWSPDERSLVYLEDSANSASESVRVIDVASGRRRVLAHHEATLTEPTWSPDSRWLAYRTEKPGTNLPSAVWVVSASGGAHWRLMHAVDRSRLTGLDLAHLAWL
jgi:Tol biopolymer transport system component